MQLLEYYQNQIPQIENFVFRKCQLPHTQNINLYGVRGSGKTSLVLDLITQEDTEALLYIDLDDAKLILEELCLETLNTYIKEKKITLLVLDHYKEGYFDTLPEAETLILLSRTCINAPSLTPIELFPLDYEEFLAFEHSASVNTGFNHFLRSGTLPLLAQNQKTHNRSMKTFFQSAFSTNEQKLLLILAQHHTKHLTTHQIYSFAKAQFKVSKDWLYKTIKKFEEEKILLFIKDRYQKSGKKMLLFDFAFAKYLSLGQPFILQFDTMIALALMKHHINAQTLGIHGYITQNNELIIPAPFESEESLWIKSQNKFSIYKKHKIKKVSIITINNSYEFSIEKLPFEALPFDEWSIISEEE